MSSNITNSTGTGSCDNTGCVIATVFISIISITGIIANIIVISVVNIEKKLRTQTFIAIACLSVADLLYLLWSYPNYIIINYYRKSFGESEFRSIRITCAFFFVTAGISSIIHLMYLMLLRYVMIVYPLRSHTLITNKRIIYGSIAGWGFSVALGLFYTFTAIVNRANDPILAHRSNIAITLILSITPVTLIIVVHLLKARALKKSLVECTDEAVTRMSKMITFVIIAFLVTTLPINIKDILEISFNFKNEQWFVTYSVVCNILLLLNYTINPFIYFFHSSVCRNILMRMRFKRECYQTSLSLPTELTSDRSENKPLETKADTQQ